MRPRTVLVTCLLVALIGLPPAHSAVTAAPNGNPLSLPVGGPGWQKITVDSGPSVGQSLSLAIHPLTNIPYISYYDGVNADLKLAFPVSSGGDCGPGNSWSCSSIKFTNTENFGAYSSIDFNSSGNWGISYASIWPTVSLSFHGSPSTVNTQFFTSVQNAPYGSYFDTSFRFNPNGVGSMAYLGINTASTKIYLNFASYNAASSGTCGLGNHWDCETIAQVSPTGLAGYPSLVYWGLIPMIAYRDATYGRLYYAARAGLGSGNCPFSNQWICNQVDSNSIAAGGISFFYDPTYSAIAYYDSVTHSMIVANSTSGVCGWTCSYIEDVGAQSNDTNAIAIAYRSGKPLVAYTDRKNPNNTILKVAYPDPNGNCGPILVIKHTWRCEVVDDEGGTKSVGKFISMGVTPSNVIYIAYSNDTDGTLKLAYQDLNLFLPMTRK